MNTITVWRSTSNSSLAITQNLTSSLTPARVQLENFTTHYTLIDETSKLSLHTVPFRLRCAGNPSPTTQAVRTKAIAICSSYMPEDLWLLEVPQIAACLTSAYATMLHEIDSYYCRKQVRFTAWAAHNLTPLETIEVLKWMQQYMQPASLDFFKGCKRTISRILQHRNPQFERLTPQDQARLLDSAHVGRLARLAYLKAVKVEAVKVEAVKVDSVEVKTVEGK